MEENELHKKAKEYYEEALELEELELYLSAIEKIEKAIKLDPNNTEYSNKLEELEKKADKQEAEEYYHDALKLEKEENYEEAINCINKAIELDPNNTEYKNKLKELQTYFSQNPNNEEAENYYKETLELEKEENYEEAINCINKAIKLVPRNQQYQNKLQELQKQLAKEKYETVIELEEQEKYRESIELLKEVMELDPKNSAYSDKLRKLERPENYYKEALNLELEEKYEEAIECINKAIELAPKYSKYSEKLIELKILNEEKIIERQEMAQELYSEGINLKTDSRYFEAIEYIKKAIELDPDNTEYKNKLKLLERRIEKQSPITEEELEEYRHIVACHLEEIEKKMRKAKKEYQKAIKLSEDGNYNEAIEHIKTATELRPNNLKYMEQKYFLESLKLELEENYEEAIKCIKEAIQLNSDNTEYRIKLQELEIKYKVKQCKKAKKYYQKALELEKQEKYEEAINCINTSIELDPDNTEYKNKLEELKYKLKAQKEYLKAICFEQNQNYDEAITYCEEAIKLDPNNSKYYDKLEELKKKKLEKVKQTRILYEEILKLERRKKYEKAIKCCKKLINLDSKNKEYKNKLEELQKQLAKEKYQIVIELEKEEKYEEAIKYLKKVIKLDPKNSEYSDKLKDLEEKLKKIEAEKYYKKAKNLMKKGFYSTAMPFCEKAIELDPNNIKYKNTLKEIQSKI